MPRLMRIVWMLVLAAAVAAPAGCRGGGAASGPFANACVAADHELASRAGLEVLRAGGNAVDAAVATSFALSVVRPESCGIGGGGFMVIHLPDDPTHGRVSVALNYREMAPGAAGPDYYQSKPEGASVRGGAAVAVPGTVAGLLHALERYGTMDRATVLAPAIRLAERGFEADRAYVSAAREVAAWIEQDPARRERFAFVWERFLREGRVREGDRIRLPEQATALRMIAEHGAAAYYDGPIGEAIVRAVRGAGGDLTMDDLRGYRVEEVEPLRFEFAGRTFLTMPPPSSGGVAMAEALGIFERLGVEVRRPEPSEARDGASAGASGLGTPASSRASIVWTAAPRDASYVHPLVESFKHAFADRAEWLADPAFVQVPVGRLLSDEYLEARAATFDPQRTLEPGAYGARRGVPVGLAEDGGTSHFSVVDAHGGAVACTETINLAFGSLVGVPEHGFALNDEMDDFTTRPGQANAFGLRQSDLNLPEPGKRPLSSMTPTIVLGADGEVEAVAGASGGPRIISGTAQVLLNVLLWEMEAPGAVVAARFHHQWSPDVLFVERPWHEGQVVSAWWSEPAPRRETSGARAEEEPSLGVAPLRALGHEVRPIESVGNVQVIRRAADGRWDAASDPRKGGRPAGY